MTDTPRDSASHTCGCPHLYPPRFIVVTGGPGAGKTAVLEVAQRHFCKHVVVLPESASTLFRGGFPRPKTRAGLCAAQRAIFRVQRELEEVALVESGAVVVLCDRGTLDGLAYWPDRPEAFYGDLGTTEAQELARYSAVIHLRTPSAHNGYNHSNPLRLESATEAHAIDDRIAMVWRNHPHVITVPADDEFMAKAARAITVVTGEISKWCGPRSVRPGGREVDSPERSASGASP